MLSYNIGNYLSKRQSERYIIIEYMHKHYIKSISKITKPLCNMKKSSIHKRQFLLLSLQIIVQSIIFKKTVLLKKSIKSFVKIVHNYLLIKYEIVCFLKLLSSNGMSTKENTLQLPPQFTSSESESETEYSSFKKRGKHHKENEVKLKKKKIKSLTGKVCLFSFFSK